MSDTREQELARLRELGREAYIDAQRVREREERALRVESHLIAIDRTGDATAYEVVEYEEID